MIAMEDVHRHDRDVARSPVSGARTVTPEGRAGADVRPFKRAVMDHLLFTCARDRRDASAHDLYRWMATQRTYDERDVKRVYYLSSEFLTGRSLGLCMLNMGLYEIAETLAAEA